MSRLDCLSNSLVVIRSPFVPPRRWGVLARFGAPYFMPVPGRCQDGPNVLTVGGGGAIVIKLLDILWLQKLLSAQDQKRWLRDQRFQALSRFSKDLITLGLTRKDPKNFVEGYEVAVDAMLLVGDDNLAQRIDQYIISTDEFHQMSGPGQDDKKVIDLSRKIQAEARSLLKEFRGLVTTT